MPRKSEQFEYSKKGNWGLYTLFQKKRNIFEDAFLLEKSVCQWNWSYVVFFLVTPKTI